MHVCEILYNKLFRTTIGFQRGRAHYWIGIHFQNVFIYIVSCSKGKKTGEWGVPTIGLYMYFIGEVDITTSYLENVLKIWNT
jgi:hypothetical protein